MQPISKRRPTVDVFYRPHQVLSFVRLGNVRTILCTKPWDSIWDQGPNCTVLLLHLSWTQASRSQQEVYQLNGLKDLSYESHITGGVKMAQ